MHDQAAENPCAFGNVDGQQVRLLDRSSVLSDADFTLYWETLYYGPFQVHIDRERTRKGLWKLYEAEDQARQVKIKGDRVMHTFENFANVHDDEGTKMAILAELDDIINYSIFTKRILTGRA